MEAKKQVSEYISKCKHIARLHVSPCFIIFLMLSTQTSYGSNQSTERMTASEFDFSTKVAGIFNKVVDIFEAEGLDRGMAERSILTKIQ